MLFKLSYVFKETFSSLFRNATLTIAAVVTVGISLSLVGGSLLLRDGVENATQRWQGGIEFIVFMDADSSPAQRQEIGENLQADPAVQSVEYVDQEAAYDEFKEMFQDSPEMVDSVTAEVLPPSWRVIPSNPDAESIEAVATSFEREEGVREVVAAYDTVKTAQQLSEGISLAILIVAGIVAISAAFLILNSIRSAVFARRREVSTMKLVGATNWFVRTPFILEGVVQGVLGAAVACGAVLFLADLFEGFSDSSFTLLQGFRVSDGEVTKVVLLLLAGGATIGALGSGWAVGRFLRKPQAANS